MYNVLSANGIKVKVMIDSVSKWCFIIPDLMNKVPIC